MTGDSRALMAAPREFLALAVALAAVDGRVPCRGREEWQCDDAGARAKAADACWDCPLLTACAEYADAADERHGVWAGVDRTTTRTKGRR